MNQLNTLRFSDSAASDPKLVGGKGANLGLLTQAGFKVPAGFVVTTAAYDDFMARAGLTDLLTRLLAEIHYEDPAQLDACAGRIRSAIEAAVMPAPLVEAISAEYGELGATSYVAVRSSGTAEDLAGASFAGLHDTYLDIRAASAVVDAVKRCWASLWSGRALAYRHNKQFEQSSVRMAVVVQLMVESEVSGVMFTGNPLTASTTEIVINASWGLGEAVVQGLVTPDQYVVKVGTLRLKEQSIGNKTVQIVRDPQAGVGTIEKAVPEHQRRQSTLVEPTLKNLAELGRRVMAYYEGIPQDIEWGTVGTDIYVLQSRPITGVDFSWDEDVDGWQPEDDDDDIVWSRTLADDVWTGAITPLFFCWRGRGVSVDYRLAAVPLFQSTELAKMRYVKYYRGEAYVNARGDRIFFAAALPGSRASMALKLPPNEREEALKSPFSYLDYVKILIRAKVVRSKTGGPYGWMRILDDYFANRLQEAKGVPDEQLRWFSDGELKRYITKQKGFEHEYNVDLCFPGMFIYCREMLSLLELILTRWYDGANKFAYSELITGTRKITATVQEHFDLYDMSMMIRDSDRLSEEFNRHPDAGFFTVIRSIAEGKPLAAKIDAFLAKSGPRGHSDRDIYFPRYLDDLGILHRALGVHMKAVEDPRLREAANNTRRDAVAAEVEENLRRKPFGMLKAEAFKWVLDYVLNFLEYRDNERHFIDNNTYSVRKAYLEVNRRIRERGRLETDRDFWFLSETELYQVLDGHYNARLIRAKVAGRMRNFDRFDRKEWTPPKFLHRDHALHFDEGLSTSIDGQTVLRGLPTARGYVKGTARVVKELTQIGRVNPGEILVANSTDPGWTPVFAVISGVIVETGGVLCHSSCLAREYGFPSAQIEGALQLIPDGATITVNGDTGEVRILQEAAAA